MDRKGRIADQYSDRLSGLPDLILPVGESWARPICWVYAIRFEDGSAWTADAFASALKAKGVESRPFFLGMHQQPIFQQRGLFVGASYPVADQWSRQGLYLPSGLALTERQIDEVCAAIREILGPA
jgi:perosamine synthetase